MARQQQSPEILLTDRIQSFRLDGAETRGRLVRLGPTLDAVLAHHDYPDHVAEMVVEAVLLTALIGHAIKLRWKLSLQIRGKGPLRLIATDFHAPSRKGAPSRIRAYAGFDDDLSTSITKPGIDLFGEGYFAVIIDQGKGKHPYQGITPLAGHSLAACAETFFAQSEQLATMFKIDASNVRSDNGRTTWRGGGLMLQQLPSRSGSAPDAGHDSADSTENWTDARSTTIDAVEVVPNAESSWERVKILLDSAQPDEIIGEDVSPEQLIHRLFHAEGPLVSEAFPVAFGCSCSAERVRRSLSIYSAKDIRTMIDANGKVTADCQFCGAHFEFEPTTLGFEAQA